MMCYEIYYANKEDQIPRCESLCDAYDRNQEIQGGCKLDINTLKGNDTFRVLLESWLEPCIQSMREADGKNWDTETLFFKGANGEAGKEFCEAMRKCVRGSDPYGEYGGNGISCCPYNGILKDVADNMSGDKEYLKLRVMAVCIFLSLEPKDVFSTGESWWLGFMSSEKSTVEVSNGQTFAIQLENVTELWPNELSNPGREACTVNVTYEKMTYKVTIPGGSSIPAVFADQECTRLVNLKSNLFVVRADANGGCKIGVRTGKKLFLFQSSCKEKYEMTTAAAILDAAPDGNGSLSVLYDYGVGFLGTGEQTEEKPIRIYGAGDLWIWQYKDQTLRSNGEGLPSKAVSIVVEADGTTRIWDGKSAWKCEKIYFEGDVQFLLKESTAVEFVESMMAPISGKYCDSICANGVMVSIDKEGGLIEE